MKLPIPHDWDGETWECYQIKWPVSVEYRAILIGFLSFMTRGRAWDERSGTILEAQQIAWEIFDKNNPLTLCSTRDNGNVVPIPIDGTGATYALVDWSEIMGIFVTGAHWEAGKLVLEYGPCCAKDVLDGANMNGNAPTIDELSGGSAPDPETIDPEWEPPQGTANWACRKAWALGKAWEDLMLALIAAVDMDPFSGVSYIKAQLPYVDMSSSRAAYLLAAAQIWERALPLTEMQWDSEKTESVICETATGMVDLTSAMTEDEFSVFFAAIERQAGYLYALAVRDFYRGFEKSRWRQVISSGIFDDTADCTCPEQPVDLMIPPDATWAHEYDFTTGAQGWTLDNGAYEAGVGIRKAIARYDSGVNIWKGFTHAGTTTLLFAHWEYPEWPSGMTNGFAGTWGFMGTNETRYWYDTAYLGQTVIDHLFNQVLGGTDELRVNLPQFTTLGVSGYSTLSRLVIAGSGTDPFPDDPDYPL